MDMSLKTTISHGDVSGLEEALQKGRYQVDTRGENGFTPFLYAVLKRRVDMARVLLDWGANPDARSDDGFTAVHTALAAGGIETLDFVGSHISRETLDQPSENGDKPVDIAARKDRNTANGAFQETLQRIREMKEAAPEKTQRTTESGPPVGAPRF